MGCTAETRAALLFLTSPGIPEQGGERQQAATKHAMTNMTARFPTPLTRDLTLPQVRLHAVKHTLRPSHRLTPCNTQETCWRTEVCRGTNWRGQRARRGRHGVKLNSERKDKNRVFGVFGTPFTCNDSDGGCLVIGWRVRTKEYTISLFRSFHSHRIHKASGSVGVGRGMRASLSTLAMESDRCGRM